LPGLHALGKRVPIVGDGVLQQGYQGRRLFVIKIKVLHDIGKW
jgi:hypothetical protein